MIWKEDYKPYGERVNNNSLADGNRLFFTGKPLDAETGLSYFGARYYDPAMGRFMGVDAVDFKESNLHSFNRYAYGNNNPYRFVDPDGNEPYDCTPGDVNGPWAIARPEARAYRAQNPTLPISQGVLDLALIGGNPAGDVAAVVGMVRTGFGAIKSEISTIGAVRDAVGKGNNITVKTQREAEAILEKARPEIKWQETYGPKTKVGKEIHPVDGSGNAPGHNSELPHIKWRDWSGGKAAGAEGHIYFESVNGKF